MSETMYAPEHPILHIYAQHTNHDPAYIAGNRAALQLLRDALNTVLAADTEAIAAPEAMDNSGEGYAPFVILFSQTDIEALALPYDWDGDPATSEGKRPWDFPIVQAFARALWAREPL